MLSVKMWRLQMLDQWFLNFLSHDTQDNISLCSDNGTNNTTILTGHKKKKSYVEVLKLIVSTMHPDADVDVSASIQQ